MTKIKAKKTAHPTTNRAKRLNVTRAEALELVATFRKFVAEHEALADLRARQGLQSQAAEQREQARLWTESAERWESIAGEAS